MRFVYSVVRFVPDPARGEFINVGLLVGSEESGEWEIRQVENPQRARWMDERRALPAVWEFIDQVGRQIDAQDDDDVSLFASHEELTEHWLRNLSSRHQNVVQLTPPRPIVAETADEAMDALFPQFILDPTARSFAFRKKHPALAAVRRIYAQQSLRRNIDYFQRVLLVAAEHKERFDFAVADGHVNQLAHTWSFEIPDQEGLAEDIKSWGWTARRMREEGGRAIVTEDERIPVPQDVDLAVVYVPPQHEDAPAFREALDVTETVGARFLPLSEADRIRSALGEGAS